MVNKKIFTGYKVKPMKPYFPNFLLFFMKISHRSLPSFRPIRPIRPVPCAVALPPPPHSLRPFRFFRSIRHVRPIRPVPCAVAPPPPPPLRFIRSSVLSVPSVAIRPVPCAVALPPPHAGQEVKKLWTGILFQKKGGQVPLWCPPS